MSDKELKYDLWEIHMMDVPDDEELYDLDIEEGLKNTYNWYRENEQNIRSF